MGLEKEKRLLNASHDCQRWTLLHPDQGWIRYVTTFVYFTLDIVFICLSFMLIPKNDYSINASTQAVKAISTYIQAAFKLFMFHYYKNEFQHLEDCMNQFWTTETTINDNAFKVAGWAVRGFKYIIWVCIVVCFIAPFFTKQLFLNAWIPEFPHSFLIVWFVNWILISLNCFIILIVDVFFISGCLNMVGQFNVLKLKLESLKSTRNEKTIAEEMMECVDHHKFLLSYIEKLINIYTVGLLTQYIISTFTLCMVLYDISDLNNIYDILSNVSFMTSLTFQLASYCFPADAMIEAASQTTVGIFSCDWYNFPLKLQKNITFIMLHSQRAINVTAGGFVSINREAFTIIFKGAFSFYAAVKKIRDK